MEERQMITTSGSSKTIHVKPDTENTCSSKIAYKVENDCKGDLYVRPTCHIIKSNQQVPRNEIKSVV